MEWMMSLYRALGMPERAGIARFNGPHKLDGRGRAIFWIAHGGNLDEHAAEKSSSFGG
jgi:hypothetical protein